MNGRVYDPTLGRFISADPNVDGVSDAQGFNRYSYVGNNPLGATDPTGFFSLKDGLKIVAIVAIAYFTGVWAANAWGATTSAAGVVTGQSAVASSLVSAGFSAGVTNGIIGGAIGGFASGFAGSLLNGGSLGDAFKAGVIGGLTGAVAGGIAGKIGDVFGHEVGSFGNELERALAHGTAGGAVAEIQGGEFRHGFYAGFAGSMAGSITMSGPLKGDSWDRIAERTAISATVGGTASALSGGKFANGAVTATFQHLFNAEGAKIKALLFADRSFAYEQMKGKSMTKGDYLQKLINGMNGKLKAAGSEFRVKMELVDDEESFRAIVRVYEDKSYLTAAFVSHGDMSGKVWLGTQTVSPGLISEILDRLLLSAPPKLVFCKPTGLEDAVDAVRHINNDLEERGLIKKNE